jgi:hypothetical protein
VSTTVGLPQGAGVPLRQPRKTTTTVPAVVFNPHEKEWPNSEFT